MCAAQTVPEIFIFSLTAAAAKWPATLAPTIASCTGRAWPNGRRGRCAICAETVCPRWIECCPLGSCNCPRAAAPLCVLCTAVIPGKLLILRGFTADPPLSAMLLLIAPVTAMFIDTIIYNMQAEKWQLTAVTTPWPCCSLTIDRPLICEVSLQTQASSVCTRHPGSF